MKEQTKILLYKLQSLALSAGQTLFERAGAALDVLADDDWISDEHHGDRREAEKHLAAEYFPDVAMSGWFERLLILRRHYPDVAAWEQHRFNLQRMWIRYEDEQKAQRPSAPKKQPAPIRAHASERKEPEADAKPPRKPEYSDADFERDEWSEEELTWPKAADEKKNRRGAHYASGDRGAKANPLALAQVATARDLADMIFTMITSHPKPEQVWDLVCSRIEAQDLQLAAS